jgi:hypothetical protein
LWPPTIQSTGIIAEGRIVMVDTADVKVPEFVSAVWKPIKSGRFCHGAARPQPELLPQPFLLQGHFQAHDMKSFLQCHNE